MDHAGIYVHRQITDEKQWALAMQAIQREFCEDDVFVEKTWTLKEQAPPDDPLYWIKMTRAISEEDVADLRYAESYCCGVMCFFFFGNSIHDRRGKFNLVVEST